MSADKPRMYGWVLADRLAAETPAVLNLGDLRLPQYADQPLQAWNGSVWEEFHPSEPINRPSVGDWRGDPPEVWVGDRWVQAPSPIEDRLLADVLRRFIRSEFPYVRVDAGEVVLDGRVDISDAEQAILARLEGERT